MKIAYKEKRFGAAALMRIAEANDIIEEYQAQGFVLTIRQLYYQFVARGKIPNNIREYKNLAGLINEARLAGHIDWEAIVDNLRNLEAPASWGSPNEILSVAARQYRRDLWASQDSRVEVWIEKDALTGVIAPVCERWRLPYFACRGYTSQSEQWRAAQRFQKHLTAGQRPVILHLGDHDPSGIDMTRDNRDRLNNFIYEDMGEGGVDVHRLALNIDQVRRYNPPPNPAKLTDSRVGSYIAKHGDQSWELDALDPKVIDALIDGAVREYVNVSRWNKELAREKKEREALTTLAKKGV